jgi:hypothetical protein
MMSGTTHAFEGDWPEGDWPSWITEHQVCWELAPILEMVTGRGVQQTAYALKLFGRFDPGAHDDTEAVVRSIHKRLRILAADAIRCLPVGPLVQVEPAGRAVIPAESALVVEVELTVLASPPHPDQPLPPPDVRGLIVALEDRLRSMGLKKRG